MGRAIIDAQQTGGLIIVGTASGDQGRPDGVFMTAPSAELPLSPSEARALGVALFASAAEAERVPVDAWPDEPEK